MDGLDETDLLKVRDEALRVFEAAEVHAGSDYFHMPNAKYYPSLFAWDSGFNAVAMSQIDAERSMRELETLFGRVAPDGHMPHEVLIDCEETRASLSRNLLRRMFRWAYDSNGASRMTDPPIYVFAAEQVYSGTRDAKWLAKIWPGIRRLLDYLIFERDLFDSGLVSIVHPWEAGTDLSPQILSALGIDPAKRADALKATFLVPLLCRHCDRLSWDLKSISAANRFIFEDLTMNSITIRALTSASRLANEAGDPAAAARYDERARAMASALDELLWDDEAGCYFPRFDLAAPRNVRVITAASVLPLFSGLCEPERAARMIEEHVLNPSEFWVDYLIPFNSHRQIAGFRPWSDKKLWAGHCIWANFNWMIAIGLWDHGREAEARKLAARTVEMVARAGFWEYYDSRTGEGRRMRDFTWPGLALDMVDRFFVRA